ncbi:MAG TPA: NAD(P)-dependent oxidoreductase [Chloroflexota bacterium]
MSTSTVQTLQGKQSGQPQDRRSVLVTGADGRIGSSFARRASQRYRLRLMVQAGSDSREEIQAYGEVIAADLVDLERLKEVCRGIDTVVHLAADPQPSATWSSILPNNIVGTYHMFAAAKAAGCRRVVFASSIHAVSGYPTDRQVRSDDPVNPGDLYGVSKCFGEALGRYMAEQENLSVVAIRIGSFGPPEHAASPQSIPILDSFVSDRDLTQLIQRCIEVEDLRFAIFNGVSDNDFKRLDISDARARVGYQPEDNAARLNMTLHAAEVNLSPAAHNLTQPDEQSGLRQDL